MKRPDTPDESVLRRQIVDVCHRLHQGGLLVALDGNVSARLPDGSVLCTRAGVHKGLVTEDDLVVVDAEGRWLRGLGRATSELAVHLACYRARPDARAVVHSHPPSAIAASVAGVDLDQPLLPEVVLTLGTLPTVPYATTGTAELAAAVAPVVRFRDAVLLERHGVVALGADLLTAFCHTETAEQLARVALLAAAVGPLAPLPHDEAVALRRAGLSRYGGPPASVACKDDPGADLAWRTLPTNGENRYPPPS